MHQCRNPDNPCPTWDECLQGTHFTRNTAGRGDRTRAGRHRDRPPRGDCAVVALALTAGMTYEESRRRLQLVSSSLNQLSPTLQALLETHLPGILQHSGSKDPRDGTSLLTLRLTLALHGFEQQTTDQCLRQTQTPRVVIGTTPMDTVHALPTRGDLAQGTYDTTQGQFRPAEAWALHHRHTTDELYQLDQTFRLQARVTTTVAQTLKTAAQQPVESRDQPEPGRITPTTPPTTPNPDPKRPPGRNARRTRTRPKKRRDHAAATGREDRPVHVAGPPEPPPGTPAHEPGRRPKPYPPSAPPRRPGTTKPSWRPQNCSAPTRAGPGSSPNWTRRPECASAWSRGFETELGYFDLQELAETTVFNGVPAVERDLPLAPHNPSGRSGKTPNI